MIKVDIKKNSITITGHAMYDESGKDIVCAAVSSIVITTINGLVRLNKSGFNYEDKEGFVKITINKIDHDTKILLENMISLLKELEKKYNKYIKIYEEV